jgi:hypothetical protein
MTMLMHHMLRAAAGAGAAPPTPTDPQFNYVSMLLNDTGTNGQQNNTFLDSSSNNFTVTRNGTPTQGSVTPYWSLGLGVSYNAATYGGSGYFPGATTDYLSLASNAAFALPGAFTYEAWIYPFSWTSTASEGTTLIKGTTSSSFQIGNSNSNGGWGIASTGVAWRLRTATAPTTNAWNHMVVVRSGTGTNQTSLFLNGVRVANGTVSASFVTSAVNISNNAAGSTFNGYMQGVRLVKGTAVYDPTLTTLTVPTSPVTAISGTSLLLNFTNAGIYDAAVLNDLTTVGNAQVSTAQAKFGGSSIAFDGTGDWLTFPDSSAMQLGTGDFTIEGWLYLPLLGTARGIVSKGTSTTGWSVGVNLLNQFTFAYTTSTLTAATALTMGQWVHFAVVRNGSATGNVKIYFNGVLDATSGGAVTDNFNQTSIGYVGADRVGTSPMNGYIDELRITKGYARYTANFTPPTAPFPTR